MSNVAAEMGGAFFLLENKYTFSLSPPPPPHLWCFWGKKNITHPGGGWPSVRFSLEKKKWGHLEGWGEKGGGFVFFEKKRQLLPPPPPPFNVFSLWERKELYHVGTDVALNGVCRKKSKVRRLARLEQLVWLL